MTSNRNLGCISKSDNLIGLWLWTPCLLKRWPDHLNGFYFRGPWVIVQIWNKIWLIFCQLFLIFILIFFLKKMQNFEKICSTIHENELIYSLCTILEWDKCQQFADLSNLLLFGCYLRSCKKSLPISFYIRLYLPKSSCESVRLVRF